MFNFKKNTSGLSRKDKKRLERQEYEKRVMNYNNVVAIELSNRARPKVAPKDSFISIQEVNKIYDNLVQAVYNFSLDIKKNEFIVFVGPSGCGKSTILRMIAGLEEITSGNLFIDGQYANSLPPKDRNIAMVFQSYALYPHMSVYDNMAFSLRIKETLTAKLDESGKQIIDIDETKVEELNKQIEVLENKIEALKINEQVEKVNDAKSKLELNNNDSKLREDLYKKQDVLYALNKEKEEHLNKLNSLKEELEKVKNTKVPLFIKKKLSDEEIDERVKEAAKILQIEEYLDRKPKALSGGQRQRVALGRAICKRAKLFLMDEPLSNLDAKLRVSMRSEIIRIHKAIGATSIYVTHDQTEAMTMADRIVIMNKGVIQQIGTPREIYNHPNNVFVATFIGSPSMNILDATIKDNKIVFDDKNKLELPSTTIDELVNKINEKLEKINDLIENGREEEYKKQLNVKIEEFKLNQSKKGYKYTHDDKGNIIDPIDTIKLDDVEIAICDNIYKEKYEEAFKRKEIYEDMLKNKEFKIRFGIRPENIFIDSTVVDPKIKKSNLLEFKISIPELLGNEYFLHSTLGDKDFIFKTNANNDVKENDVVNVFFDLEKIHIFDSLDNNILL